MLEKIRQKYGTLLFEAHDEAYYSFPTCEKLAEAPESELRSLGLGYRAKFIQASAKKLRSLGGEEYLLKLREERDANRVQQLLCDFSGVGKKVADCVAVFSLDQTGAIPVDTHVWAIACRDMDPTLKVEHVLVDLCKSNELCDLLQCYLFIQYVI